MHGAGVTPSVGSLCASVNVRVLQVATVIVWVRVDEVAAGGEVSWALCMAVASGVACSTRRGWQSGVRQCGVQQFGRVGAGSRSGDGPIAEAACEPLVGRGG